MKIMERTDFIKSQIKNASPPRVEPKCISIQKFLIDKLDHINNALGDEDYEIIEFICHKIDVNKSIKDIYSDEYKYVEVSRELEKEYLEMLLMILLHYAEQNHDFKYLNTAFKIINSESISARNPINDRPLLWADDIFTYLTK